MTDIEKLISWLNLFSVSSGKEFTLSSGETSTVYIDVKKTVLHHRCHKLVAKLLWDKMLGEFRRYGVIQSVAGVALGGCHLASIVAMYAPCDLDVVYVRNSPKNHGTENLLERPHMFRDQQIVLIEDVVTTGKSSSLAAKALEQEGYNVLGIISVVDRRTVKTNFIANQWPFVALVNIEQLTV